MKIDMTTSQQLKLKCYELAIQHRRDRPDLVMLCAKSLYGCVRAENNAPVDHPLTIDLQKLENAMQNVFENPLAGLPDGKYAFVNLSGNGEEVRERRKPEPLTVDTIMGWLKTRVSALSGIETETAKAKIETVESFIRMIEEWEKPEPENGEAERFEKLKTALIEYFDRPEHSETNRFSFVINDMNFDVRRKSQPETPQS